MIIKGSRTIQERIDVEVSELDIINAYKRILAKKFDLPINAYLADGKVMEDEEVYTSHSWTNTRVIRDATEMDERVLKHFQELHALQRIER